MKRFASAFALVVVVILATPSPSFAASATFFGPIVPAACHCDNQTVQGGTGTAAGGTVTTAPDYGCVLQVIQNVINFAISISIILFVLFLALSGFQLIISGGSPGAREKAKTRLLNVVIGMIVLLCAWLLVDFIMKTIYNDGSQFGPWNAILAPNGAGQCIVAHTPTPITTGTVGILTSVLPGTGSSSTTPGAPGAPATPSGGTGDRCTLIPDSQLVAIDGSGHKLIPEAAQRFNSMKAAASQAGITLTVTSAYRSPDDQLRAWNENGCHLENGHAVCAQRTAAIPCSLGGSGSNHSLGTAVDLSLSSGVATWMKSNGGQYGFINDLPNDPVHFSNTGH